MSEEPSLGMQGDRDLQWDAVTRRGQDLLCAHCLAAGSVPAVRVVAGWGRDACAGFRIPNVA